MLCQTQTNWDPWRIFNHFVSPAGLPVFASGITSVLHWHKYTSFKWSTPDCGNFKQIDLISITCSLPYWKVQVWLPEEDAVFGYFAPPSHCFNIRKWWPAFCWDESCFTLFACPKWVGSPQVEEIVHVGLQGYFQFRSLYTSERSASFEDFNVWKFMQIFKPAKTPDNIVGYWNYRHHRHIPNWKGEYRFYKQLGYVGASAFYLRDPP